MKNSEFEVGLKVRKQYENPPFLGVQWTIMEVYPDGVLVQWHEHFRKLKFNECYLVK